MRILRSFTKTKKTAPLSQSLRPTRHDSAVRTVKSSSDGEGSWSNTATTTCVEVSFANWASFASSRAASPAGTTPA
jgi:hypothetical protein